MPHYRTHGKVLTPLTEEEFLEGMQHGKFCQHKHRAFLALLHYSGVRKGEALRTLKEQFKIERRKLSWDVGVRFKSKHKMHTLPLKFKKTTPYISEIIEAVKDTAEGAKVFPYSSKTGYNIVARVFKYPHYHRLSRITWLFDKGFSIAEVRTWTGLSLKTLDYYLGFVSIDKISEKM